MLTSPRKSYLFLVLLAMFVGLLPSNVHADNRQLQANLDLRDLLLPDRDRRQDWRLSTSAGGLLDTSKADNGAFANLTGEWKLASPSCDPLVVGGTAQLYKESSTRAAMENWASFCWAGTILGVRGRHRLAWNRLPSLAAPYSIRRDRVRTETLGLTISAIELSPKFFPEEPGMRLGFFVFDAEGQAIRDAAMPTWTRQMSFEFVHVDAPTDLHDRELSLLKITDESNGSSEAGITRVSYLSYRYTSPTSGGWLSFEMEETSARSEGGRTMKNSGGHLMLGSQVGDFFGGAEIRRSMHPTLDGFYLVEQRYEGTVRWQPTMFNAESKAFAATTKVIGYPQREGEQYSLVRGDWTAGVSLAASRPVGDLLVSGTAEYARSYYNELGGDASAPPRWGGRFMLQLSHSWEADSH